MRVSLADRARDPSIGKSVWLPGGGLRMGQSFIFNLLAVLLSRQYSVSPEAELKLAMMVV